MKRLVLAMLSAFLLFCTAEAQLIMDCNGDVGIGNFGSSEPLHQFHVKGDAYFSCQPAVTGISIKDYGPYAMIIPDWSNYACVGYCDAKFDYMYTRGLHYDYLVQNSDLSIKENIREIENPLSAITNIRGVIFDYKREYYKNTPEDRLEILVEEGKNNFGVIAQELKEVVPELVKFNEESELYEVNYIGLIPILVEAIQEQQAMIENLQSEVQALNNDGNLKSASITTAIDESLHNVENALKQNSPNPFHESTEIFFSLSEGTQNAVINVYNMSGTQLKSIELHQRGEGRIVINGGEFDAGMYMYAMIADGRVIATKQMILTD